MSSSEGQGAARARLAELAPEVARLAGQVLQEEGRGGLEAVSEEAVQKLLAAAVRLYAARHELHPGSPPFGPDAGVTATDVMVAASSMLRALDLELFELAMWQAWARP